METNDIRKGGAKAGQESKKDNASSGIAKAREIQRPGHDRDDDAGLDHVDVAHHGGGERKAGDSDYRRNPAHGPFNPEEHSHNARTETDRQQEDKKDLDCTIQVNMREPNNFSNEIIDAEVVGLGCRPPLLAVQGD